MDTLAGPATRATQRPDSKPATTAPQPLLMWALVLLLAMMSFYIHLLNDQVSRGQRLREEQRLAPDAKASAQPPRQPSRIRG